MTRKRVLSDTYLTMNKYIVLAIDGSEYDSEGNEVANSQLICRCMAKDKSEAVYKAWIILQERGHFFDDLYALQLHDDENVYNN